MHITVKKWGNSASIRLPAAMMKALDIQPNSVVNIRQEQGRLVIEPVKTNQTKRKYSLDELLSQITEDNQHQEMNFGKPVGKEIW
ncbi:AbrB/MazE/SpoVT family DNA-binding domain-containing protein [Volucribacter amazonae]|uniref:PbsX family transcriptional regulator n=1 Tax=Volucribacter amazonae TaxID=256731 RepID=A0A9X4SIL8_9PAST|nr:AbrB/MazE/SpoVT family DNA-binding domain-containing protein [Volucribacter amazonae]MDG6895800.1 PbsX family transcriptional regulator [Volucribacter amazonae]